MKYLIVECIPYDGYDICDPERIPRFVTDDWKNKKYDYSFEVYEIKESGEIGNRIKEYDDGIDEGMALYYWKDGYSCEIEKPYVIYKYPNFTRDLEIPIEVRQYIEKGTDVDDSLRNCGSISFYINDNYYVYGGYKDNYYDLGY